MALTATEKVQVAEITLEAYSVIDALAVNLSNEQITSLQDDLDTWEAIRDLHVKLKGGSDGVDFDNKRKRDAIRERVRKMFGLPLFSLEMSGSGSGAIANEAIW
jgi:hypothetical protein